jgi:hypothetical protein
MRLAEQRVSEQAAAGLPAQRLAEMTAAANSQLFVAGRYPAADWESVVGFAPDQDFHYEVTVGIAVDHGERPNILAKVLISRDAAEDFCFIRWYPSPGAT